MGGGIERGGFSQDGATAEENSFQQQKKPPNTNKPKQPKKPTTTFLVQLPPLWPSTPPCPRCFLGAGSSFAGRGGDFRRSAPRGTRGGGAARRRTARGARGAAGSSAARAASPPGDYRLRGTRRGGPSALPPPRPRVSTERSLILLKTGALDPGGLQRAGVAPGERGRLLPNRVTQRGVRGRPRRLRASSAGKRAPKRRARAQPPGNPGLPSPPGRFAEAEGTPLEKPAPVEPPAAAQPARVR